MQATVLPSGCTKSLPQVHWKRVQVILKGLQEGIQRLETYFKAKKEL